MGMTCRVIKVDTFFSTCDLDFFLRIYTVGERGILSHICQVKKHNGVQEYQISYSYGLVQNHTSMSFRWFIYNRSSRDIRKSTRNLEIPNKNYSACKNAKWILCGCTVASICLVPRRPIDI